MSIEIKGVTKYYGEQKALDNVSFEVRTGEIAGFLGPNGAGKSTLMKIITGFIPPSSGKILIDGTETGYDDPDIRRKIGYLPENNPLYPEMYVREYLGFVASFYMKGKRRERAIEDIIQLTGLGQEQNKKIGALSKGYRQRVGLAQALIHNPEILILDEATSGLDPNQITEIRSLIKEAGKSKTVLLSTHIMQEVEAICSRIIIIDRGRIVADGDKDLISLKAALPNRLIKIEFDREAPVKALEEIPGVVTVKNTGENTWLIETGPETELRPEILSFAIKNNLNILSLSQVETSLEEIFRILTT